MVSPKLAFRTLFKSPFVTTVAIVSLALGVGANAAIFSLFEQMLLRPLPVPHPAELVNLVAPGPKPGSQSCGNAGDCDDVFSYPMFRDLERLQASFTGIAAHLPFGANLTIGKATVFGDGLFVSGSYFSVLGLQAELGRLIGPTDDRAVGESNVAVLSDSCWQTRFARDPGVLNQALVVNGQVMTIVGVAPRGFTGTTLGAQPEVFVPITMRGLMQPGFKEFDDRRSYWAYLFARRKPGVSLEQALAAINGPYHAIVGDVEAPLQTGMSEQTLARFRSKPLVVRPGARGQSTLSGRARAPLTLLLGVSSFVLLIACANIANLLLVRAAGRAGEMAIRLSIGASRRQLVAQLLGESCLLALFGGVAGLLVARWTLDLIASLLPAEMTSTLHLQLDAPVIAFAAALTLGTGLLFGLFPALHSTRPDLVTALKGQAGQPSGARAAARFRTSLATTQIALSMALLVSAGLFTKSLSNVSRVDLGARIDHVVTFRLSPRLNAYSPERSRALYQRLEDELAALPGTTGVTASSVPLLASSSSGDDVSVQGFAAGPDTDVNSRRNRIGTGYFRTLGIPLLAGREFTDADSIGAPTVAVVNEAFARKFNLGRDAVGKRIGRRDGPLDTEIVGLVQDAKYNDVKREVPPLFFLPYRQDEGLGTLSLYVRTSLDPEALIAQVPGVVARIDPNLPIVRLRTMPQQVRDNVYIDRFISVLSAAFACLATLLAAIGLYGVLAYSVSQRTREIGLRMALGAAPGRVRVMVLRQVGLMTLVGGAVGLAAAVWLGRLAESLLYQLRGSDPPVLAGAVLLLALVALGAGSIPAYRASRLDPMRALRYE